jgi:hypothetical protein
MEKQGAPHDGVDLFNGLHHFIGQCRYLSGEPRMHHGLS